MLMVRTPGPSRALKIITLMARIMLLVAVVICAIVFFYLFFFTTP